MEAVKIIVMALATGAASALKPVAGQAVKDAYERLKAYLKEKYAPASATIPVLEQDPAEESFKDAVAASLKKTEADQDEDVVRLAQEVLKQIEQVQQTNPSEAVAIVEAAGVLLEDVRAGGNIRVESNAGGVIVRGGEAEGDIEARVQQDRPKA